MNTSLAKYFACKEDEVSKTGKIIVTVKNLEIGIFKVDDGYYAWRNMCPHAAAPVCAGHVGGTTLPSSVYQYRYGKDRQILRCPWHGWEFDLTNGTHLADPSVKLRGYPVLVQHGNIYLLLSGDGKGENHESDPD